ncbi:MAG: ACP S-malonyltransferase [Armatimonadaceae bacterium]
MSEAVGKKLVFVFPGQGAQSVGMGRDLNDHSKAAQSVFHVVDEAVGFSVSRLCFEGPEEALKETQNTQPALYAASLAAFAACREAGLKPAALAGHSVGEYAALSAAAACDVLTGAKLVATRGAAMAAAAALHPGTMAAVLGLDAEAIAEVCAEIDGVVVPANDNAPGQVVISGDPTAVEAASVRLKERGAKRVVPLAVSGAFHSPLMQPAVETMEKALADAALRKPALPVIANVTAEYVDSPEAIRANLANQVAGPVRWVETIRRFVADGYDTFVECGPGTVLTGLIKRIAPEATVYNVSDTETLQAAVAALGGSKESGEAAG